MAAFRVSRREVLILGGEEGKGEFEFLLSCPLLRLAWKSARGD